MTICYNQGYNDIRTLRWQLEEKVPVNYFGRARLFPVPRNTAVGKIGNGIISLLWQLLCHCNPDHNAFSSLSNRAVVVIFPKLRQWRHSLCLGIDPEKPYRVTSILLCQPRSHGSRLPVPGEQERDAILLHRDWGKREPNFQQPLFLPDRALSGRWLGTSFLNSSW